MRDKESSLGASMKKVGSFRQALRGSNRSSNGSPDSGIAASPLDLNDNDKDSSSKGDSSASIMNGSSSSSHNHNLLPKSLSQFLAKNSDGLRGTLKRKKEKAAKSISLLNAVSSENGSRR